MKSIYTNDFTLIARVLCLFCLLCGRTTVTWATDIYSHFLKENKANYAPAAISVSGTVIDSNTGEPIEGATILVAGSSQGAISDEQGKFTLNVESQSNITLTVKYLGYLSKTVSLNESQQGLTLSLVPDIFELEGVVITGQGLDVEKRRVSNSITTVNADRLQKSANTRLDQLLQSEIPNFQIRFTGGQPGATSITQTRGINSIVRNSTPIIYVDGVRVDNLNTLSALGLNLSGNRHQGLATSAIADIPVSNIERVEFINGGAATTLFGSDAGNGVIQIFTKKGGNKRTNISLEATLGAEEATTDFYFFDRTKDLFFRTGLVQEYKLAMNGGNEKIGFSFGGTIFNNEGARNHNLNENTRYDLRTSLRVQVNNKLTLNSTFGYTNNQFGRVRNGNAGGFTALWFAEAGASLFTGPGFDNNIDGLSPADFQEMKDYVFDAERLQNNTTDINRFQNSQILEYRPLDNWRVRATVGVDYRVQREVGIVTNEYLNHTRATPPDNQTSTEGRIQNFDRKFLGLTLELNTQYDLKLGDFSFLSTLGGQIFRNDDQQNEYTGLDVRDGAQTIAGAATLVSDEFRLTVANYGAYFQENIGFKNRYFIEFGIRGDRNSAFGDNIGTAFFPKVGLSYVLSDEKFIQGISNVLSYARLRANYGIAGNFPTPFANQRTISFQGYQGQQSATFGQPGNDDLEPERVNSFEAGVDLAFFQDRISLTFNVYNTETEDALFFVPLSPSTGQTSSQLRNVGTIENKGIELSANFVLVKNTDWNIQLGGSFNTLDNEVTDAGGSPVFNINGFSGRTVQTVVEEGQPVGFLRGNVGTFASNGVYSGTEAQQFLGSTLPETFGSVNLNAQYKGISLFANADYQTGAFAHSFDRQFRFRYGVDNEGVPQAEIDENGTGNWLNFTDLFVEKTDFFKIRLIGLKYDFPPQLFGNILQGLSVSFTAVNPINFASSSFDPEATQSGGRQGQGTITTGGINYSVSSAPRQYLGTINLSF